MKQYIFRINEQFDINKFDSNIQTIFAKTKAANEKMQLVFDLRRLSVGTIRNLISTKPVLDKHRESSKQLLHSTEIFIGNVFIKAVLQGVLAFLRPEKPVRIKVR